MERVRKVLMLAMVVGIIFAGIGSAYALEKIVPVELTVSASGWGSPFTTVPGYGPGGPITHYPGNIAAEPDGNFRWDWYSYAGAPQWVEYDLGGLYEVTISSISQMYFLYSAYYTIEVPDGLGGWKVVVYASNPAPSATQDLISPPDIRMLDVVTDKIRLRIWNFVGGDVDVVRWEVYGTPSPDPSAALAGQVSTLAGQVSTLTGTVNTLSGDVSDLGDDLDDEITNRTNADSVLQGQINALSTAVSNLQGQINALNTHVHDKGSSGRMTSGPMQP